MASETVRITGVKELLRDLGKVDKDVRKGLVRDLKELAEPVLESVKGKSERFGARTVKGEKIGNRGATILVRQSIAGRGGPRRRRNFGGLLMRTAFLPALAENEERTIAGVEHWLDTVFEESGL